MSNDKRKVFCIISMVAAILSIPDFYQPLGFRADEYTDFLNIVIFITSITQLYKNNLSNLLFGIWTTIAILYNPIMKIEHDNQELYNLALIVFICFYLWGSKKNKLK